LQLAAILKFASSRARRTGRKELQSFFYTFNAAMPGSGGFVDRRPRRAVECEAV